LAATLVEQVFEAFSADTSWREGVPSGANGRITLGWYLKNHWLSPRFHDQFVFLAEFDAYYSGSRIHGGREAAANFRETLTKHLVSAADASMGTLLEQGIADGSLRADLDLHLVGVTLLNAVRSLQQRVLLRGEVLIETLPGEPEKMPFMLVDLLMDGLKPSQGEPR